MCAYARIKPSSHHITATKLKWVLVGSELLQNVATQFRLVANGIQSGHEDKVTSLNFAWDIAEAKYTLVTAVCVSVCLPVPRRIPTLLHGPGCNLGYGRGCPLVVHCWADLQSVHGFRCYYFASYYTYVCKHMALFIANAYSAEREMPRSVYTRSSLVIIGKRKCTVIAEMEEKLIKLWGQSVCDISRKDYANCVAKRNSRHWRRFPRRFLLSAA